MESTVKRRDFLNILLGIATAAWAGVIGFPILRYLKPPPESGGVNEVTLNDDDIRKIKDSHFTIVRIGTERVIVFEQNSELHALAAKCTHEGCTVGFKREEDIIWCACHNAKFSTDGLVISGPPPRPLEKFFVHGTLDEMVTISKRETA